MPSNPSRIYLPHEDECEVSPSAWRCAPSRTWISNHTCKWCDCLEEEISFELSGCSVQFTHSIHSFIHSFCSSACLEIEAWTSFMCFSFVIHEMEMIILICFPHKFVERINWCLDRVLKPYANIKVIHNKPHGITELKKKEKQEKLKVELMLCSRLGFQAHSSHSVCCSGVGFVGLPCPCSKVCTMGGSSALKYPSQPSSHVCCPACQLANSWALGILRSFRSVLKILSYKIVFSFPKWNLRLHFLGIFFLCIGSRGWVSISEFKLAWNVVALWRSLSIFFSSSGNLDMPAFNHWQCI